MRTPARARVNGRAFGALYESLGFRRTQEMDDPALAAIASNRFGLGARPGELARVGKDPRGAVRAQLAGGTPQLQDAALKSSADILSQALELRRERRAARTDVSAAAAAMKVAELYKPIYADETSARIRAALATERPFVERLTYFWNNHFAISIDKAAVLGLAGSFEREAIRPRVLGNFSEMLLAATRHPAMLLYLDNQISIGPHSQLAERAARHASERRLGINENLAREILELRTLGVAGATHKQTSRALRKFLLAGRSARNPGVFPTVSPENSCFVRRCMSRARSMCWANATRRTASRRASQCFPTWPSIRPPHTSSRRSLRAISSPMNPRNGRSNTLRAPFATAAAICLHCTARSLLCASAGRRLSRSSRRLPSTLSRACVALSFPRTLRTRRALHSLFSASVFTLRARPRVGLTGVPTGTGPLLC